MAVGIDGADTRDNLAFGLEERGLFPERYGDLLKQLEVLFACLAHVALFPEVELRLAEGNSCIRIGWLTIVHQAADVVGMAVGDDDHVHLLRRISCSHDKIPKVACGGQAPLSVARIEQNQLLASVDERGNEMVIEIRCRQTIHLQEVVHVFGRLILSKGRMWARSYAKAVEDLGHLEAAELKAIDLRAQHAQHRRRAAPPGRVLCHNVLLLKRRRGLLAATVDGDGKFPATWAPKLPEQSRSNSHRCLGSLHLRVPFFVLLALTLRPPAY